MLNLKNNPLVKAIAIVVLSAMVWTVGYLSGLEIGQKKAEQKFNQQSQNQNNQQKAILPQIPDTTDGQDRFSPDQLPQIPQVAQ